MTQSSENDRIVVGFSQLGAESDWRSANTESMKSTFTKEAGYDLIFEDGQQKQANQIRAIRTFIQQEVDYIVLAPVTETGWDTVLREAKDAGIPVIIVDRKVDVEEALGKEQLFTPDYGSIIIEVAENTDVQSLLAGTGYYELGVTTKAHLNWAIFHPNKELLKLFVIQIFHQN